MKNYIQFWNNGATFTITDFVNLGWFMLKNLKTVNWKKKKKYFVNVYFADLLSSSGKLH